MQNTFLLAPYLDFREGNCLSHKTSGKKEKDVYKTYGEVSTTCHHFDYRPLVIDRFTNIFKFMDVSSPET